MDIGKGQANDQRRNCEIASSHNNNNNNNNNNNSNTVTTYHYLFFLNAISAFVANKNLLLSFCWSWEEGRVRQGWLRQRYFWEEEGRSLDQEGN